MLYLKPWVVRSGSVANSVTKGLDWHHFGTLSKIDKILPRYLQILYSLQDVCTICAKINAV